jgi:ring-1,2-phenylacetyl-CoA epoxidase subunit PaaE
MTDIIPEIIERKVKVKLYYEEHELTVPPDESILQTAMNAGIDPPFSCQVGACDACRAKMITGEVYMETYDALEDEEVEDGWVLTCQAHPLTDNVYLDYDVN